MLTGAGDGEADAGRVPRADTGDLAQTTVGLAGKTGDAPTGDDALGTVTLRGSEHIDTLVLSQLTTGSDTATPLMFSKS